MNARLPRAYNNSNSLQAGQSMRDSEGNLFFLSSQVVRRDIGTIPSIHQTQSKKHQPHKQVTIQQTSPKQPWCLDHVQHPGQPPESYGSRRLRVRYFLLLLLQQVLFSHLGCPYHIFSTGILAVYGKKKRENLPSCCLPNGDALLTASVQARHNNKWCARV